MAEAVLRCESEAGCSGELVLCVMSDKSVGVFCEACVAASSVTAEKGIKVYRIGDDITHHFI